MASRADGNGPKKESALEIHAWNYRGFRRVKIDLTKVNFVVGDNSSGKSSLLHLVNLVLQSDLNGIPAFNEDLGVDRYDYFSPYFDLSPVSFCYEVEHDEDKERLVKIITVVRRAESVKVERATFFYAGIAYVIVRKGSKLLWKRVSLDKNISIDELYKIHNSSGFKEIRGKKFSAGSPSDFFMLLSVAEYSKNEDIENGFFEFYSLQLDRAVQLAPVRSLPEKYYLLKRTVHSSGKHFAALWHDIDKPGSKQYFARLSEFGRRSGLFERIRVYQLDQRAKDSPLAVTIRTRGKDLFLNQVGVGISQLIPVLVELIVAQIQLKNSNLRSTILLQQPELHLHPVAQAELGSYMFDVATNGVPLIVETHSSYLIDRFRSELKEASEDKKLEANLLFCSGSSEGNSCIEYKILNDGSYLNPPREYLRFFLDETLRTML